MLAAVVAGAGALGTRGKRRLDVWMDVERGQPRTTTSDETIGVVGQLRVGAES